MDYDSIASFYDINYQHYTDDLPFYLKLAQDYGGPVLELGAGTGRVSVALAQQGIEVVALEPSAKMRKLGKAKSQNLPIEWISGDMRKFSLKKKFPLVIAPFNAIMHLYTLEEQDATLACVKQHLAKGGRFAFDVYNPAHINASPQLRHEGDYDNTSIFIHQEQNVMLQQLSTYYLIDTVTPSGSLKRQRDHIQQRYYTKFELERWLRSGGFKARCFGGFNGEYLDEDALVFAVQAYLG